MQCANSYCYKYNGQCNESIHCITITHHTCFAVMPVLKEHYKKMALPQKPPVGEAQIPDEQGSQLPEEAPVIPIDDDDEATGPNEEATTEIVPPMKTEKTDTVQLETEIQIDVSTTASSTNPSADDTEAMMMSDVSNDEASEETAVAPMAPPKSVGKCTIKKQKTDDDSTVTIMRMKSVEPTVMPDSTTVMPERTEDEQKRIKEEEEKILRVVSACIDSVMPDSTDQASTADAPVCSGRVAFNEIDQNVIHDSD